MVVVMLGKGVQGALTVTVVGSAPCLAGGFQGAAVTARRHRPLTCPLRQPTLTRHAHNSSTSLSQPRSRLASLNRNNNLSRDAKRHLYCQCLLISAGGRGGRVGEGPEGSGGGRGRGLRMVGVGGRCMRRAGGTWGQMPIFHTTLDKLSMARGPPSASPLTLPAACLYPILTPAQPARHTQMLVKETVVKRPAMMNTWIGRHTHTQIL